MTTYEPGDVAIVTTKSGFEFRAIYRRTPPVGDWWEAIDHKRTNGLADPDVSARPLVVIDPESAEDTSRLWRLLADVDTRSDLTHALREFAAPTPPKCPTLALQTKNAECSFDPGHDGWHTDNGMGVSWA